MTTSRAALSPSGVPLRPLGVAEVLDGAVRIVRHHPRIAFGFAAPLAFVRALLGALLVFVTYSSTGLSTAQQLGQLFIAGVAGVVLSGMLAPVVVADVLGSSISGRAAIRRARSWRGLALLAILGIAVALAQTLGVVLAVVGGVWLWGVWAAAGPAMAVEGLGPIAAVARSFRLVKTQFWRAWGVRALGWVLTRVLGLLITLPVSALAAYIGRVGFTQTTGDIAHPTLFITVTALGQLLAVALVSPITAAIDGLIYTDLRMRVEGLDLVVTADPTPAEPSRPNPVAVSAW